MIRDPKEDIKSDLWIEEKHRVQVATRFRVRETLFRGKSPFQEGTNAQKIIWHQVRHPKSLRGLRSGINFVCSLLAVVRPCRVTRPCTPSLIGATTC